MEQMPPEYLKQTAAAAEKRKAAGPSHLNVLQEGPIEYRNKVNYRS
jgi:hypothetical protein